MNSLPHRLLLILFMVATAWQQATASDKSPGFEESEVIRRVERMESEVTQPRYDIVVRSYLRTYLVNHRKKAEIVLGRRLMYFPVFEDYLRQNNIPTDLKYLAIVESALEPRALSRVGAGGLWQFMPGTARGYGMRVDDTVDERSDLHKSTQAASEYLMDLYTKFNNWELAIAAYNSGSGRISRAVKRGRSTNYWKIRSFLPSETRNYVPAFIAATYLVKHFKDHDLVPEYPDMDLQMTETVSIFKKVSFEEVTRITGLSREVVAQLNPAFLKGIVPANERGYYFTLPRRVMPAFRAFLDADRPDYLARAGMVARPVLVSDNLSEEIPGYAQTSYRVLPGESLSDLALKLHCSEYQLRAWNDLPANAALSPGQDLIIFQLRETLPIAATIERMDILEELPLCSPVLEIVEREPAESENSLGQLKKQSFIYYQVRKPESINNISLRFRIDVQQLRKLNQIKGYGNLKPGTVVRIAEFESQ